MKSMKPWSRYNTLFSSEKHGFYLFNALSGTMLELDRRHYERSEAIRDGLDNPPDGLDSGFLKLLEEKGFLATSEEDASSLMQLHYNRNAACFGTSTLGLCICPTLSCNFSCVYCYEHGRGKVKTMDTETVETLVSFVKNLNDIRNLSVTWFGGEPTLSLEIVRELTYRFLELFPGYGNAGMVTNAYLLDETWIAVLDELRIGYIQVTLDGREAVHDCRRMLNGGGPTYRKIMENIDLLMNSRWQGNLAVRINVDRPNMDEFSSLREEILQRYTGKKVSVYPGYVNTYPIHPYDRHCGLCTDEWSEFLLEGYNLKGIVPRGGFFPYPGYSNTCLATSRYGYVIGPAGEMYKCLEDVGNREMVVGSIFATEPLFNREMVARYSTGVDPFTDITCMECPVLPLCGGGCASKRLRAKYYGQEGLEYCSVLKRSLIPFLEAYIDTRRSLEICNQLLGKASGAEKLNGYRMVQPERKNLNLGKNPLDSMLKHD